MSLLKTYNELLTFMLKSLKDRLIACMDYNGCIKSLNKLAASVLIESEQYQKGERVSGQEYSLPITTLRTECKRGNFARNRDKIAKVLGVSPILLIRETKPMRNEKGAKATDLIFEICDQAENGLIALENSINWTYWEEWLEEVDAGRRLYEYRPGMEKMNFGGILLLALGLGKNKMMKIKPRHKCFMKNCYIDCDYNLELEPLIAATCFELTGKLKYINKKKKKEILKYFDLKIKQYEEPMDEEEYEAFLRLNKRDGYDYSSEAMWEECIEGEAKNKKFSEELSLYVLFGESDYEFLARIVRCQKYSEEIQWEILNFITELTMLCVQQPFLE